eukprot:scaffold535_cov260-Pinguiococcus_pyrenoidosus.AAC.8
MPRTPRSPANSGVGHGNDMADLALSPLQEPALTGIAHEQRLKAIDGHLRLGVLGLPVASAQPTAPEPPDDGGGRAGPRSGGLSCADVQAKLQAEA